MKAIYRERLLICLLSILILCCGSVSAKTIKVFPYLTPDQDPQTLNAGLAASELGYHPDKNSSWGESWYMLAHDKEMNQIWVLLSVSNYSPLHKFAGTVDLFYYGIDGTKAKGHVEVKSKNIEADLNSAKVNIGGSTLVGAHPDYRLKATAEKISLDLTYHAETPDFQLGRERIYFGEKKSEYWTVGVMTPRAKVTGTVTIDGKAFRFDGLGYYDHGRSNIKVPTFSDTWHVLRAFEDDLSIGLMQVELKKDFEPGVFKVLHITEGDRVLVNSGDVTLTPTGSMIDKASGFTFPTGYTIAYENGQTKLHGTMKITQTVHTMNVLEQISPVLRAVVKALYTDPWQSRLIGQADLTFEYEGKVRQIKCRTIHEIHKYK